MSARFHHGEVRSFPVRRSEVFTIQPRDVLDAYEGERIVYLTSPHNPTGSTLSLEAIRKVAEKTDSETLVVVDEAYGAFADVESANELIGRRDDVAVLRSFSKSYGLAGLRLGFAIVPESWSDAYRRVNTPFATSEIACRAGLAAIGDHDHFEKTIEMVRVGRSIIRSDLKAKTWPSEGNFVLADVGDAASVSDALLDRGVIVRDCTSFGLPSCIRITVGPEPSLTRAIEICNEVIVASDEVPPR